MDPATLVIGGLALWAMLGGKKKGAYGAGSTHEKLGAGRYRVAMQMAPQSTITELFAAVQATLSGVGMSAIPEAVVFRSPTWRVIALAQANAPVEFDTLPGMTFQKDPPAIGYADLDIKPGKRVTEIRKGKTYRLHWSGMPPQDDVALVFGYAAEAGALYGLAAQPESLRFTGETWTVTLIGQASRDSLEPSVQNGLTVEEI